MFAKRIILVLIVAAIVASPMTINAAQQSGSEQGSMEVSKVQPMGKFKVLEGSWLGTATFTTPFTFSFKFLATFNQDGALVVSQAPYIQRPTGTTTWTSGHGEWEMISKGKFAFTFLALVHDAAGTFLYGSKVNATIEVDATMDNFTGEADTFRVDADGNEITPHTAATVTGKRIRVGP
jgi:hypothetical protein